MIKYEIFKESEIEIKMTSHNYTVKDLASFSASRRDMFPELIFSFSTLDEAKAKFEEEKQYCDTRITDGYIFPLILFDELFLVESEYDEDGNFIQSEILDEYIEEWEK